MGEGAGATKDAALPEYRLNNNKSKQQIQSRSNESRMESAQNFRSSKSNVNCQKQKQSVRPNEPEAK